MRDEVDVGQVTKDFSLREIGGSQKQMGNEDGWEVLSMVAGLMVGR